MRKLFTMAAILVVALAFTACAPATTNKVQGTDRMDRWELQVNNDNWNQAKVYLMLVSSSYGARVATVPGLGKTTVTVPWRGATFRIRVEFLASRVIWTSQLWGPGEPCLELNIRVYVPQTYIMPC